MLLKKIKNKIKSYFVKSYSNSKNKELLKLFSKYKTCYILGSSPSINKINLTKLSENVMKISMGNFYEHPNINKIKPSISITNTISSEDILINNPEQSIKFIITSFK